MRVRILCASLLCWTVALCGADKKLPVEQSSNDLVEIEGTLVLDRDEIRKEVGSDLGGSIIMVRMRVRPLTEKPVRINLDDFFVISGKDGQRSTPYTPSQIAGASTLMVTPTTSRQRGSTSFGLGPVLGGSPGTTPPVTNKVQNTDKPADNALLATLKEKVLPEKEVTEPASGLLFFQIEGKLKPKDLELYYKTPSGRLGMRFRP
jgi:hypothetical protein